jgi:6-pyruvoyltetrahydropterin/6-carboxytetrahydropterin synthase
MFRVTRRYNFAASHRLHAPQLSDEENRHLYGKCNNPFGHGHNYVMEVSARGPLDPATGRAVDVEMLDEFVRRQVLGPFNHRNLNLDVDSFQGLSPTSENLLLEISRRLKLNWNSAFPGEWPRLEKVRIAETPRNIFEMESHEIG